MEKKPQNSFLGQLVCLLMTVILITGNLKVADYCARLMPDIESRDVLSADRTGSFFELIVNVFDLTGSFPQPIDSEEGDFEENKLEPDYFFYPAFTMALTPMCWQLSTRPLQPKPTARLLMLVWEITPPPPKWVA